MHPLVKELSLYLQRQFPQDGSSKDGSSKDGSNHLKESLFILQALCDQYGISNIHEACNRLSNCSFLSVHSLMSMSTTFDNDLTFLLSTKHNVDSNLDVDATDRPFVENKSSTKDRTLYILICTLTTESSKIGSMFLNDATGQIECLCANLNFIVSKQKIFLTKWNCIMPYHNSCSCLSDTTNIKTSPLQYVEIDDYIYCCKANLTIKPSISEFIQVSDYLKQIRKQKVVNLEGVLIMKSPVHKLARHSSFFFIRLQCKNESQNSVVIVVQGRSFMHWHSIMKMFHVIQISNVQLSVMNKGTNEERKVLCLTKESRIIIGNQSECIDAENNLELVNYVVSTQYKLTNLVLYCPAGKSKLKVRKLTFNSNLPAGCGSSELTLH